MPADFKKEVPFFPCFEEALSIREACRQLLRSERLAWRLPRNSVRQSFFGRSLPLLAVSFCLSQAMKQLFHAFASRAVRPARFGVVSVDPPVLLWLTLQPYCSEAGSVAKPGGGRAGRVALGLQVALGVRSSTCCTQPWLLYAFRLGAATVVGSN